MRAIFCTQAVLSGFTRSASRMRASMWGALSPMGHVGAGGEKISPTRQLKLAEYTTVKSRVPTVTLSTLLLTVTVFVFIVCMIDTVFNFNDQVLSSVESTAAGLLAQQTRRALQSSITSEVDLEARQKIGALHGMGITFRTGSRAMNELIIAHLVKETSVVELKLFLRTLHRSGATARADVVLLFPWTVTSDITRVIDEEDLSFQRLILDKQATAPSHQKRISKAPGAEPVMGHQETVESTAQPESLFPSVNFTISPFNSRAFWKSRDERKLRGEMIWNSTINGSNGLLMASVDWADWGSIVGFEMQDLDQDGVLEGFLEDPPAQIKRWICYQMLLGMTKSKYRSVLLTEVWGTFILRDVLAAARKKAFSSGINLYQKDLSWADVHKARKKRVGDSVPATERREDWSSNSAHQSSDGSSVSIPGRRLGPRVHTNSDSDSLDAPLMSQEKPRIRTGSLEMHFIEEVYGKDVWKKLDKEDKARATLGSGFILGSMKPVKSLANAILTEIAGIALKRKSREPFHDGAILNHLVQKSSVLTRKVAGNLHQLSSSEAPVHSLPGSKQPNFFLRGDGHGFAALVGLNEELMVYEKRTVILQSIRDEICHSKDSWAYPDCAPVLKATAH